MELFPGGGPTAGVAPTRQYDVTADGQGFLMSTSLWESGAADTAAGQGARVIIVQNWVEELEKRVPVD